MTSTEVNLGLGGRPRPSSRILKPPGGGHSDIFSEGEVKANPPRPKYDQQNSSNLNFVMNTVDPNIAVEKTRQEKINIQKQQQIEQKEIELAQADEAAKQKEMISSPEESSPSQGSRVRVPPGGFSSGLW